MFEIKFSHSLPAQMVFSIVKVLADFCVRLLKEKKLLKH